jgi:streptogrisin C
MALRTKWIVVGAVAVAAVASTPFISFADEDPTPPPSAGFDLAPGMVDAMRRDLNLTDDEIATRLTTEAGAPVVQRRLKKELGSAYGGAWIPDGADKLTVAVTDPAQADEVRAGGADVQIVERGQAELDRARATLDRNAGKAGAGIRGWYVDVETNSVVVVASPGDEAAATKFAKDSGAGTVEIKIDAEQPKTIDDIRGGDQYVINGADYCSVGFAVAGGFVSAGHCGSKGDKTTGYTGVDQGVFAGSVFPGKDYSFIRTADSDNTWTPQPWVNNYDNGMVLVSGSTDAAIGSSVCRSGQTTGWRCGTLQSRDETVKYHQGTVTGLSRTSACAEPGDSGGSFISGNQAQGVASGTTGDCAVGGNTWFQPVNPILNAYGLTLTTAGGNQLVSALNGKCVDVPAGRYTAGQDLQMYTCNGTDPQRWAFSNGALQTKYNLCVEVSKASTSNSAVLQLNTCNSADNQQFIFDAAGELVNPVSGRCVDIRAGNTSNGAQLIIYDCKGSVNQKWKRV